MSLCIEEVIDLKKGYFWGFVDEDCPEIVLSWLMKSYNITDINKINSSDGATTMEMFVNPFHKFTIKVNGIYEWTKKELSRAFINPRIKISETGPTNDMVYSPPMLYFIGKKLGVVFNKSISNIHLLYHTLVTHKNQIVEMKVHDKFDPKIPVEKYLREELESFIINMGYNRIHIKRIDSISLYETLTLIYTSYYFKYEGCICVYSPDTDDPICYTENDLVELFTENIFNPVTKEKLTDEQLRQLLFICRKYHLAELSSKIMKNESIQGKIITSSFFIDLMNNMDRVERVKLYTEISKIYEFLSHQSEDSSVSLFNVTEYFTSVSTYFKTLPLCIGEIKADKNIGDVFGEIINGNYSLLTDLKNTLKCYLDSKIYF